MLAKAVKQHDSAPPSRKAPTLSQQLFPSSSPAGSQDKSQSSLQQYLPQNKIFKPSASIVHNVSRLEGSIGQGNPLKRTAAQAHGMGSSWSKPTAGISKENAVDLTQSTHDGGRVGKLHDTVYFDENDFVDDADLDLDVEDSATKDHLLASKAGPAQVPPSSMPIPWSSSPLQHKAGPSNANSSQQPISVPVEYSTGRRPEASVLGDVAARPSKRRTLPWLDTGGQGREETRKMPPPHVQQIIDRQAKARQSAGSGTEGESFTPLPNDKSKSPYPWNKTASVLKEEQRRLRQANKKLVKSHENDGSDAAARKREVLERRSVARVFLSDEQKKVLNLVAEDRKSVFFTGSAGTGKSVLLREIIKVLRERYRREPDRVAVTASTGLAACNVGGVTLHSFSGIGLGKEGVPELVKKIKKNQKARNRWMRTKVLVVDEISMVDGELFDKLEGIARTIRSNGRPFGGIQLVITGDFFQLPPVPDSGRISKFAFDAGTWNTSIEHTIGLTQVFRQKDPVFANMLNEMRLGRLSQKSIDTFRTLSRPLAFDDELEATELFPTRIEVENANNLRMRNLGGTPVSFSATDGGTMTDLNQRDKLLANCMAPPSITLKKGSQVMLIKNIDETLVNGSLGKVVAFMDEKTFDIYDEDEEKFQAIENGDLKAEGMSQSRVKLKEMMNKDGVGNTSQKWPLVRFHIADGTTRDLLCQHESWKIELPNGEIQASRSQIPLILAWALSIHKAQGQTLERVKVDLGRIFEKGQAYVALSRATCQEGLQITRFDPKKVMAHDKVRSFYDSLYSIDQAAKTGAIRGASNPRGKAAKGYEQDYMQATEAFDEDEDALQQLYG